MVAAVLTTQYLTGSLVSQKLNELTVTIKRKSGWTAVQESPLWTAQWCERNIFSDHGPLGKPTTQSELGELLY
jgi:hypothetical protein